MVEGVRPAGAGAAAQIRLVFARLHAALGAQHWWPATTPFEVMLGAILTQNTAWTNVERALAAVGARVELSAEALLGLPEAELASLLRPVGYFNVKARRLRAFCDAYLAAGGQVGLAALPTARLRARLLAINGVGPETADDMLLYAFDRPVFVVDAYTRRLFTRLGVLTGDEGYERIRACFEGALGLAAKTEDPPPADVAPEDPTVALYNEYHALIVRHAKDTCRARNPRCGDCVLADLCPAAAV